MSWNAWVSANNTISIRACSFATGQNAAAQTWRADVWQH